LPWRSLTPTLAATGSEMNNVAVISNEETALKSFVVAECLYLRLALVDPELTVSVPPDQTAFSIYDLITHVTEGCFNDVDGTPIQDRFTEGVILTAMQWGPKVVVFMATEMLADSRSAFSAELPPSPTTILGECPKVCCGPFYARQASSRMIF
jgi:alcohol dehydrogenase YqhD (iron-dependent ADH family)